MALGVVTLNEVVVPEIFNPYMQNITEQKTRIIQSGAVVMDAAISSALAGAGLTFKTPSFSDLDNDLEDIMTDDVDDVYGMVKPNTVWPIADAFTDAPYTPPRMNSNPRKMGSMTEISVRLSRHQSWSSLQLAATLAGKDPLAAIANRVAYYWARRRQAAFIAIMTGIFADNDAPPTGTEHVQFDLTFDAGAGGVFAQGVSEFTTANFLRAALTMGDSQEDLGLVIMHSIVFHKAQLANLIEFVPDAINNNAVDIPFFLGRRLIVDDGMPFNTTTKVAETWMFGPGAVRMGVGSPDHATELERAPRAGGGAGQTILHTRVEWCMHPAGYQYVPTAAAGGPSNAATAGNLAHLDSWKRVFPERKQIKVARLKTIEA